MKFFGNDDKNQLVRIARFNPDDVFALVREQQYVTSYSTILCDGREYRVHLAASSLRLFKKSRECAACGLIGTAMFLEERLDKKTKEKYHAFALYAESRHYPEDEPNFIRMSVDHIIPKRKGGSDHWNNLQVLCTCCNRFKDITDLDTQDIRRSLQMMKRIIYSGRANRRMRMINREKSRDIERLLHRSKDMRSHLERIPPKKKQLLLDKIREDERLASEKKKEYDALIVEAQITGSASEAMGEEQPESLSEALDDALQIIKKIELLRDDANVLVEDARD